MNQELIKELEEMRIKLDSMIKRVDYENPAFDILLNAKDMLGYAQFDLNQLD
jgi:hypothetical protein